MQKNPPVNNLTTVNVNIQDILTSKTCAHIIIEIIKYLAYQKLQIPHPYDILKYLVQKKRDFDKANPKQNENIQSRNHFRVASCAVDVLDSIFLNIIAEMESDDPPDEVLLLWGAIPMNAREVCRIRVPSSLNSHFYNSHIDGSRKLVMKTLRNISFSQDLLKTVHLPLAPTNMFVLLKRTRMHQDSDCVILPKKLFLPTNGYQISAKIPQTEICLSYECNVSEKCCKGIEIFSEGFSEFDTNGMKKITSCESGEIMDSNLMNIVGSGDCNKKQQWFQSNVSLKGFKDACVRGKSLSDSWLKSCQENGMTATKNLEEVIFHKSFPHS